MKRFLLILLRILIAAGGVGYILYAITWHDTTLEGELRPGLLTMLRTADLWLLIAGLLIVGAVPPLQAMRWWRLMRCRGMDVGFIRAFRLTLVGGFFNFCMPGTTGGDVIKVWYAVKGSSQRGAAFMSIVFDRFTGIIGLALLAGLTGLSMLDQPLPRRITIAAWVVVAAAVILGYAYGLPSVRRFTGLEKLASLSPKNIVRKLDRAAVAYHQHKTTLAVAVLLSLGVHTCIVGATALAGQALDMQTSMLLLITVLPVVLVAGSLPLTYQGLGVMEAIAVALLVEPDTATANQVVAMLVFMRLYLVCYGLMGSLVLLRGDIHLHPQAGSTQTESTS